MATRNQSGLQYGLKQIKEIFRNFLPSTDKAKKVSILSETSLSWPNNPCLYSNDVIKFLSTFLAFILCPMCLLSYSLSILFRAPLGDEVR